MQNNWISVDNRLPKGKLRETTTCLVYDIHFGVIVRVFNAMHKCWDDESGDDNFSEAKGWKNYALATITQTTHPTVMKTTILILFLVCLIFFWAATET